MTASNGPTPLPTGTVAFLMTDIEGSTQLVGRLGEAWSRLPDDHFALMRASIAANGGTWISSEGAMDIDQAELQAFAANAD